MIYLSLKVQYIITNYTNLKNLCPFLFIWSILIYQIDYKLPCFFPCFCWIPLHSQGGETNIKLGGYLEGKVRGKTPGGMGEA